MPPRSKTREEIIAEAKILPWPKAVKAPNDGIRTAALRTLPFGTVLTCKCQDCGLERTESVSNLVQNGRLGGASAMTLEHLLHCQRMACGGELEIEPVLPDA